MPSFEYRAKTGSGENVIGTIDGRDERAAEGKLREQGYSVQRLRENGMGRKLNWDTLRSLFLFLIHPILSGATPLQLSLFYRQLAVLLKSGITPAQAMDILSKEGVNPRLQQIAGETEHWLQDGSTLSSSLSRYPWIFTNIQVSILRAGEQTGDLENCLISIAQYLEWEHQIRQKIKVRTVYPKILALSLLFIPNLYLLVTGGVEAYVRATFGLLASVAITVMILWIACRWSAQIPYVRYVFDMVKLALPKVGRMIRMRALVRFYRSFAAMYSAGVPLITGMGYAVDTTGNEYLKRKLKAAIPKLEDGRSIEECLESTSMLPHLAISMLHTGKLTGNVDVILDKLAEYTEKETEFEIEETLTILPVVLFLIAAACIMYMVILFYTTHASMNVPANM